LIPNPICRSYLLKSQIRYGQETGLKKSDKGRICRSEQVTPQRSMELSLAYAPPLIISAGVSNQVFDSLENGAKTPPYVRSATAPRGWNVPVPHGHKTASCRAIFGQNTVCHLSRHRRHHASEAAWQTLCASTEISCHPFPVQSL
jgi:hypothetical protein